jgi:iron complex outermembrane recepter protein
MRNQLQTLFLLFIGMSTYAQTVITGSVVDSNTKTPVPGVNITITNSRTGTNTDFDGKFRLETKQAPPFKLSASSVGFESMTLNVTSNNQKLEFVLKEGTELDEVVVSASRTPERIFESPVTVEKLGITAIRNSTSPSFYGGIESLKGVQINQGGIFMKQISTRGFSTVYNEGFVQLVDMMDNSAPGLNFPMGNLLGLNELDVKSVELMPGASSALYGANAIKGILFMNSISPFDKQGISAYLKTGVTSQDAAGDNLFKDLGVRMAHKFSDKFAAKASISYVEGTDWQAEDFSDYNDASKSSTDIDYNGTNIYGEQTGSLTDVFIAGLAADPSTEGFIPTVSGYPTYFAATDVASTGYEESDLTNYTAKSIKVDAALHYKISETAELSWNSKLGMGDAILQATNRNMLKDFQLQQHKLEYRNNHLTMRAYATIEDSGDTHDASALAGRIANAQPGGISTGWYGTYLTNYLGAIGQQINAAAPTLLPDPTGISQLVIGHQSGLLSTSGFPVSEDMTIDDLPGVNTTAAHAFARAQADANMLVPGSPEFEVAKQEAIGKAISEGGAAIQDNSKSYSFEGNYNFKEKIQWADVIVGGSYKIFSLDSNGTLFTDYNAPIEYDEYGVYGQAIKSVGKLKLTGSLRYDKSEFFDGNFTPRFGVLYNINENQNFRVSYQTGFRNPSSQDQFIGLNVGTAILMGASSDNVSRFKMNIQGEDVTGQYVFDNALSLSSVLAGAPTAANLETVVPEQVESYEFGYRINQEKFNVDLNGYFSKYTNFLAGQNVVVPLQNGGTQVFQVDGNTDEIVNTYGANLGINTKLFNKLKTGIVYEYNKMDYDAPANSDYEPGFNTPENRVKLNLSADKVIGKLNLGMNVRWNEEYYYESTFVDAMVPENTVIDFQANYPLSNATVIKVGASNLFGKDYIQIPGSGMIGQVSYISLTYNP